MATNETDWYRRPRIPLVAALIVSGIVIPCVVLVGLSWWQGRSFERLLVEQERALLSRDATIFAERARAFLEPSEQDLDFVRGLSEAAVVESGSPDAVERFLFERSRTRTWVTSLFMFDEATTRLIMVGRVPGRNELQSVRQGFDAEATTELRRYDEAFRLIALERRPSSEFEPRSRPWYALATGDSRIAWTRPYILFPSLAPGITVVAPILDAAGTRHGVVGASLRLGEFSSFLKTLPSGGRSRLAVVGADGDVLATTLAGDDPIGTIRDDVAARALEATGGAASNDPTTVTDSAGNVHLAAVVPLFAGTDRWMAVVHEPIGERLAALRAERRREALIAAAGLGLASLPLILLTWTWIARPLRAVRSFAKGRGRIEDLRLMRTGPLDVLGELGDGIAMLLRDLAARRAAEKELQSHLTATNHQLESLLERAPLAVIEVRGDGSKRRITRWAGRSALLFGVPASTVVGRDFAAAGLIPADARLGLDELFRRSIEDGLADGELPLTGMGGVPRLGQWYVSKVDSVGGEPVFLVLIDDRTETAQAQRRIEELARQDPLTRVANRRHFLERLDAASDRALGLGESVAVWALDLDDFKGINDAYGHIEGDGLLRLVAERLVGLVDRSDTVARVGGDEFMILQTGLRDPDELDAFRARLAEALAVPFDVDGRPHRLSSGVGVAMFPDDATDPASLLRHTDLALLAAKREGRGQLRRFGPDMAVALAGRRAREDRLREAIRTGDVFLVYQPIWMLEPRLRIVGAEALVRWNDGDRLTPPDQFVPLAEETGLIHELGELALRLAAAQVRAWSARGLEIGVAVNVSPTQLRRPEFATRCAAIVAEAGIGADRVDLEITEGVFLESTTALAQVRKLQDHGFSVSIDDFGTGYANLGSLAQLRPSRLKVDRRFVSELSAEAHSGAIARAMIGLARNLGISALAEGVETAEQLDELRRLGCPLAQGFYLGRPVAGDAIPDVANPPS